MSTDAASRQAIRQHLAMIAVKFSQGDFSLPMFFHDTVPPGVDTMKELKSNITYEAEKALHGAQLRITTNEAQALAAIHRFLRFQIQDHQTGELPRSAKVKVAGLCTIRGNQALKRAIFYE